MGHDNYSRKEEMTFGSPNKPKSGFHNMQQHATNESNRNNQYNKRKISPRNHNINYNKENQASLHKTKHETNSHYPNNHQVNSHYPNNYGDNINYRVNAIHITKNVAKMIMEDSNLEFGKIEEMMRKGASTNDILKEYNSCTLLHLASGYFQDGKCNYKLLAKLLEKSQLEDLAIVNDDGLNLFHISIEKNDIKMLELIVNRCKREKSKLLHTIVNEKGGEKIFGRSALHFASIKHNLKAVELLISIHGDGNVRDMNNQTALELAMLSEADPKIIDILMECTKILKVMKKCLNNFSIKDCRNVIFKFTKMGLSFKLRNRKNNTPLMIAAQFGDYELLEQLLFLSKQNKTEGIEALDDNFHTALHFSCSWNHLSCVKLLLDHGANIEAKDNQGNTPLCRAAQWNRADVCKLLLENGANANAISNFNKSPIELAFLKGLNNCEEPHWDVINVLIPYSDISSLLFKQDYFSERSNFYAR